MVLGHQFIFCCDICQLKWLLFWFKVHVQFTGGRSALPLPFRGLLFFLFQYAISCSYWGDSPTFVYYLPHFLFYCLYLKYTYHFLYICSLYYAFIYYLIPDDTVFCFPCKVKAVFNQFKSHTLLLEIFNPCVIHLLLFGSLKLILVAKLY